VKPVEPVNPRPGTATHAVAAELNLYVFPLVGSTYNWVSVGDPGKLIAIFILYLSYIYVTHVMVNVPAVAAAEPDPAVVVASDTTCPTFPSM
jgi:hypothetical protein